MEADSFDLFFNKRENLCYGYCLKQLQVWHGINAVMHPIIINKANYRQVVEEVCKTQTSEDAEEDQVLKKSIAN